MNIPLINGRELSRRRKAMTMGMATRLRCEAGPAVPAADLVQVLEDAPEMAALRKAPLNRRFSHRKNARLRETAADQKEELGRQWEQRDGGARGEGFRENGDDLASISQPTNVKVSLRRCRDAGI